MENYTYHNCTFSFRVTGKFGECHALGLDSATIEPNQTAARQRSGCMASVTCTAVVNAIRNSVLADTYKVLITSGEYGHGG